MTAPPAARLSPSPSAVPVSIRRLDRSHDFTLKPDGRPFALRHAPDAGPARTLYFPGIEVDRHTEPLSAFDLERSSILRKVLGYREMVATERTSRTSVSQHAGSDRHREPAAHAAT